MIILDASHKVDIPKVLYLILDRHTYLDIVLHFDERKKSKNIEKRSLYTTYTRHINRRHRRPLIVYVIENEQAISESSEWFRTNIAIISLEF